MKHLAKQIEIHRKAPRNIEFIFLLRFSKIIINSNKYNDNPKLVVQAEQRNSVYLIFILVLVRKS